MEKVFFGDAFDGLDEDAQEGLKNISKSELKMKDLIVENEDPVAVAGPGGSGAAVDPQVSKEESKGGATTAGGQ